MMVDEVKRMLMIFLTISLSSGSLSSRIESPYPPYIHMGSPCRYRGVILRAMKSLATCYPVIPSRRISPNRRCTLPSGPLMGTVA